MGGTVEPWNRSPAVRTRKKLQVQRPRRDSDKVLASAASAASAVFEITVSFQYCFY